MCCYLLFLLSHVWLFCNLMDCSLPGQAPLSIGFPREEYWSVLPFPTLGIFLTHKLILCFLHWQADSLLLSCLGSPSPPCEVIAKKQPSASQEQSSHVKLTMLSTLISDLLPPESRRNEFLLSHPVHGILLWQLKMTKTISYTAYITIQIYHVYLFSRSTLNIHWGTDVEAPIIWPHDVKSQLIGKDPDAGKDWGQEEKGVTENEMVGCHHWLNGHEFEQTLGDSKGQRSLECYSPCGNKELDTTWQLKNVKPRALSSCSLLYPAARTLVDMHIVDTKEQSLNKWANMCRWDTFPNVTSFLQGTLLVGWNTKVSVKI